MNNKTEHEKLEGRKCPVTLLPIIEFIYKQI